MRTGATTVAWLLAATVCVVAGAARALPDEPPPPGPRPTAPPSDPKPVPAEDPGEPPSLDELLGLEEEKSASPVDAGRVELDRQLKGEEAGDDFTRAVDLMDLVATRLENEKDTGLSTQRMQEEAIRRLDKLISEARKQRQNQKKQQKQQQSQQQQQQDRPQKSQQQSGQARESAGQNQENKGTIADPAARRDGALRQVTPGGTAAWGSLPDHVRSSLMQGFSDQFSSMYQSMTEAYYRRLAEDRGKEAGGSPTGGRR